MFLQFLEKILDAPAVEIPPLHSPHLGCKHADKTEKRRKIRQIGKFIESVTILKFWKDSLAQERRI